MCSNAYLPLTADWHGPANVTYEVRSTPHNWPGVGDQDLGLEHMGPSGAADSSEWPERILGRSGQ